MERSSNYGVNSRDHGAGTEGIVEEDPSFRIALDADVASGGPGVEGDQGLGARRSGEHRGSRE